MKKLLLAAVFAVGTIGVAQAADLAPMYHKAPVMAPPAYFSWNGFYIGAHGGYGWGSLDLSAAVLPGASTSADMDGPFGGAQIGYNMQMGSLVLGIEADVSGGDVRYSQSIGPGTVYSALDFFGTVRGRIGFAADRALFYATGGLAWGHNELGGSIGAIGISDDKMHVGWTVGAGLEYAFAPQWSAKVEYLYTQYGSENYFGAIVPGGIDLDPETHSVKVGINYRFN
ncbi:MAG: porin family protein [Rhizobiales bacterium]|nr:porin family protein [Hyphomicrobiales bacterium]